MAAVMRIQIKHSISPSFKNTIDPTSAWQFHKTWGHCHSNYKKITQNSVYGATGEKDIADPEHEKLSRGTILRSFIRQCWSCIVDMYLANERRS